MKTIIKACSLALIPLLALLSCSPEVSLTSRDFNGINSSNNNPTLTDYKVDDLLPSLNTATLNYTASATDSDKELTFTFPVGADFLKKPNSSIEGELIKFLSLFTFSVASVDGNINPGTKTGDVTYRFVRRETSSSADTINIVIMVPQIPASTLMAKIDGTAYTVYGKTLDVNGDGIAGEAIYDDVYFNGITVNSTPAITNSGTWIPEGGPLAYDDVPNANRGRYSNWTLEIMATLQFVTYNENYPMPIADLTDLAGTITPEIKSEILFPLAPLFKLQEYSVTGNAWTDAPTATIYYSTERETVTIEYIANNLSIYRLYVSGLSNLVTEKSYYGAPQKISVTVTFGNLLGDTADYNGFYRDVFIVTEYGTLNRSEDPYNPQPQGTSPVDIVKIDSDHNGQNVTVQIYFNSITPTNPQGASASWLNPGMSFDTINQNFKLAYVDDETNPLTQDNWFSRSDIKFIKVNSAVLSTSNYNIPNPGGYNLITLTLDPKFMLKGRTIHLLIAQGFKYTNQSIYFWDVNGLDKYIGNVSRFGYYGTLPVPF